MTRLNSSAPCGERLIDKVPHGYWQTSAFLAAPRNDRIEAPCLFNGPNNGERFRAYVEQFLVPTLKTDDVVILDNLDSHKGRGGFFYHGMLDAAYPGQIFASPTPDRSSRRRRRSRDRRARSSSSRTTPATA